ncbi:MAG: hypothetical protein ACJA08_002469 [Cyclobacteriaceae bacterium]|jgi:hypothetical protein
MNDVQINTPNIEKMKNLTIILFLLYFISACTPPLPAPTMDGIAEKYVKLILEIGQYNGDFVDAYYGPDEWKPTSKADSIPAKKFISRAIDLISLCDQVDTKSFTDLDHARLIMMKKQLLAAKTKVEMINGTTYSFDEEAKLLYDTEPPHYESAYFDSLLLNMDNQVPGTGDLSSRYNAYVEQFMIPKDKLDTVFKTAIEEARLRTKRYYDLPENENFVLEYVTGKSWGGYNYYQGNSQSLIQINTDFPISISRAIDLACHEGYPGHHIFNAMLEQNLVNGKGWKEFSVYPLFSPLSLLAEGSANYGIDVAFPGDERVKYEKEVLFPLAGLDASKADEYYAIQKLFSKLTYARTEADRKYLDGEITSEDYVDWVVKYNLYAPDKALHSIKFADQYRSYVINYNWGMDLVAAYIESRGGTADQPEKRWAIFKELISTPNTASSLK